MRLIAVAAVCIACMGCTTLDTRDRNRALQASDPQRQILVMLREWPARHYQPGTSQLPQYRSGTAHARELQTVQDLAQQYDFRVLSDWPMPSLGVRCFLGEVGAGAVPQEVASRVAADPRVESAQAVQVFQLMGHNDPYYDLQTSAKLLKLDALHRVATGRNVRVAQIDTGVDIRHPDLQGQLAGIRNFVDASEYTAELHGTAVAGIIAAKADNGIGIVGVAPGATLLPLRACWQARSDAGAVCTSFTLAKALEYVLTQQVRVLNLSVAGPRDLLLARLIDRAVANGITVVGALDPAAPDAGFPANHANVIPVASSPGASAPSPAVIAPGDHVLTTTPNGSFGFVSGSSFAAAHIAGIAALLLELSPRLRPADIAALFDQEMHDDSLQDAVHVVNACAMLARISKLADCTCCEETATTRRPRLHAGGHSS
jgi:subtilisin family serine protease